MTDFGCVARELGRHALEALVKELRSPGAPTFGCLCAQFLEKNYVGYKEVREGDLFLVSEIRVLTLISVPRTPKNPMTI